MGMKQISQNRHTTSKIFCVFTAGNEAKSLKQMQLKYWFMDCTNDSHPNFIGGSKDVELPMQQVKSSFFFG
ncbi:hypothetical protein HanPSC8_Chr02g0050451 [Helianthus annuus]|nr:hypothetical protein HanPSC8_Chr02g0050451 [Helianthus annuus]